MDIKNKIKNIKGLYYDKKNITYSCYINNNFYSPR